MNCFFRLSLIILCISATAFAQLSKKDLTQFSPVKNEPFKIAPGSSFSASIPGRHQNASSSETVEELNRDAITQDFSDALEIIRKNYVGSRNLSFSELTESSLTAMLHSLDPHSNYHNQQDYQEFLTDEQSEYSGIGASIANYSRDGHTNTFVTATFQDSPAFRAGLRFGDKIISVNGENVQGKDSLYVRSKLRGAKGSTARLIIERAASGKIEVVEIHRAVVPQPSIPDAYILRPGIGYIDLTNGFNYTTSDEFNAALKTLHGQGINSLIIDLRGNPGGIVEQSVKIAEKFLPAGQTILTQRGRAEIDNRTWKSTNKTPETASLVVLADGGSASASEILIGALQDFDRALVVGEKTFGKGLVQSILNLPYGSGLTLTTAKYYTPSGRSIQRDYSKGNLYDYFQRRVNFEDSPVNKSPSQTLTGRKVYSGDGILPEEIIKRPQFTSTQILLLDPLFFFSSNLSAGKITGFENYKTDYSVGPFKRIKQGEFLVGEDVLNAFKAFLVKEKINTPNELFDANRKFIITRLRYNLATAAFGSVAATQVLIEDDVQVAKAVNALPRAQNLAFTARRILQKK